EELGCLRVEFKTDAKNERARAALAAIPSNCDGIAARAARARSFFASVLNSTRRQPSSSNACRRSKYFASTFAPVPHVDGFIHVLPISSRRCSGASDM